MVTSWIKSSLKPVELSKPCGLSPVRNIIPGEHRPDGTSHSKFDASEYMDLDDDLEEPYMAQVREETPETGTATVKKTVKKAPCPIRKLRKKVIWLSKGDQGEKTRSHMTRKGRPHPMDMEDKENRNPTIREARDSQRPFLTEHKNYPLSVRPSLPTVYVMGNGSPLFELRVQNQSS